MLQILKADEIESELKFYHDLSDGALAVFKTFFSGDKR
jgi:hypothetical protein